MPYTQASRRLKVTTPLGGDVLLLNGFTGQETISRPFSFQLQCVAPNATKVPFEALLGKKITVEIGLPGGSKRFINGLCLRVAQGARDATFTRYLLDIVPKPLLLSRNTQSRIFQHLSIPDILKEVLKGFDVAWEIHGTFHPRDYCAQYRESDFAFASRLMEEEGFYYFFKHSADSHLMVIANSKESHPPLPVKSSLIFETVGGGTREEDRVHAWEKAQELRSAKATLWDHCFELPHKHLEADSTILASVAAGKSSHMLAVAANVPLELYDFPGAYAQRFDGINKGGGEQPAEIQKIFQDNARTAEVRMQAEAAASVLVHAASNCRQIVSGHKFTLERHFDGDGPWVVYQVEHVASEAADLRSGGGGGFTYQNHFSCFPFALPFRPPRVTPIPTVKGTQTAVVVGPPGEEIFTDKYGRVKVQFHWDRAGKSDTDSSCWVRVGQPIAGRRWGASFWPRIGQEVIVDFLEGDPDQPIVVGSVYNADQMPPYLGDGPDGKHKNDNKLTGVKSNTTMEGEGFNEWRFDDTKGKQQIFLHAERNMDTRVKGESMESVGSNKHLTVGGEKDGKTWGNLKELVYGHVGLRNKKSHQQVVGGSMFVTVGDPDPADLQFVVKGDRLALVEKDDHLHVKGSAKEKIDGGLGLTVEGDLDAKIGTKLAAEVGQEIHLKAGMKVVIEAGTQVTLKVGGNFVDISPAGVTIVGTMVLINSGGAAGSGSGASPASPDDAKEALHHDPTSADDAKTGYKSS